MAGAPGRRLAAERLRRADPAGGQAPAAPARGGGAGRGRRGGRAARHLSWLSLGPGGPRGSTPRPGAMLTALAGRQPAEAEEATRRHLRSVIAALLDQPREDTR